jgi:hypothetical protein
MVQKEGREREDTNLDGKRERKRERERVEGRKRE